MPSLSDLIGSFTGSTQSRAASNAANAYSTGATKAYDAAVPLIQGGYNAASARLGQGQRDAFNAIQSGIGSAHTALNSAGTNIRGDLTRGYSQARDASQGATSRIEGYLNPYIRSGQQAQGLYDTFLGLNGADAAKSAAGSFAGNDPGLSYRLDMLERQNDRRANATGDIGGARASLSRDRVQSEMLSDDYQRYLTRLSELSGRGGQYAGQAASFADAGAARLANLYQMEGRDNAQNERQHASALQDLYTKNAWNSGELDTRFAGLDAPNSSAQGNSLAQLAAGYYQGLGQNDAALALSKGQASAMGMNNILGSLGTAFQAYMGMPPSGGKGLPSGFGNAAASAASSGVASPQSSFWSTFG